MKLSNVLGLNSSQIKKAVLHKKQELEQLIITARNQLNSSSTNNKTALLKELSEIEKELPIARSEKELKELEQKIIQVAKQAPAEVPFEAILKSDIQQAKELKSRLDQVLRKADDYINLFSDMTVKDEALIKGLIETREKARKAASLQELDVYEDDLKNKIATFKVDTNQQVEELEKLKKTIPIYVEAKYPWRKDVVANSDKLIDEKIKVLKESKLPGHELQLAYSQAKQELTKLAQMLHPRKMPANASGLSVLKTKLSGASGDLDGLVGAIKQEASTDEIKNELPAVETAVGAAVKELKTILDAAVTTIGQIETAYSSISPETEAQAEYLCNELRTSSAELKRLSAQPLIAKWKDCKFAVTKGNVDALAGNIDKLVDFIK